MSSSRGSSDPGIKFESPASPVLAGGFFTAEPLGSHGSLRSALFSIGERYARVSISEFKDYYGQSLKVAVVPLPI